MKTIEAIRLYHTTLATVSLLAYLTGEFGLIHAWLGYALAIIIGLRLLAALAGNRQLGLEKFYPSFAGLKLGNAATHPSISRTLLFGIALSLILSTVTGVLMDRGKSIALASETHVISTAYADDDEDGGEHHKGGGREDRNEDDENEASEDVHEFFANLMLIFVAMHVTYLFLFKNPLALFMLFQDKKRP